MQQRETIILPSSVKLEGCTLIIENAQAQVVVVWSTPQAAYTDLHRAWYQLETALAAQRGGNHDLH